MDDDSRLIFADELDQDDAGSFEEKVPWKILIADDEQEIHEITRIALRGYSFEGRGVKLLSAYSGTDVKALLDTEADVALILLDVVMERDDTGLALIHHIREHMNNSFSRIVLRTGQAGKAPEQEVITRYDINDYKSKTELTAQKLFTTVTASLRSYNNLMMIERNRVGLEKIIQSTATIFESRTLYQFASGVLSQLLDLLNYDPEPIRIRSAAFAAAPSREPLEILSGTGRFSECVNLSMEEALPDEVVDRYQKLVRHGGDRFFDDDYISTFQTKEGARSFLYLAGCKSLSDNEKNLVRIYTTNAFIGFDNLSLNREIIETQKEVVFTLGEIVETRSKETAHHVTRVAEFSFLLAIKSGMKESTAQRLKLASPMHDIGKIGIPEAILHKPGKLTKEEFDIIKTHADTGYYILKNSKRQIMQTAAIVAWQHHERWDGAGYPQGLSGEDIHVYGRIVAIADVLDALTHKRCYKDAWPIDRVKHLFQEESGKHFDPGLTSILLSSFDEFEAINREFPGD